MKACSNANSSQLARRFIAARCLRRFYRLRQRANRRIAFRSIRPVLSGLSRRPESSAERERNNKFTGTVRRVRGFICGFYLLQT